MSYWGYPRYVPVGEKQEKSKKKLEQLRKRDKNVEPVIIEGRTLAHTWWGKAWNKNLEGYADYSNRMGRGRSYVRCGSVLDLKISEGKVRSLVLGSESKPYSIVIKIKVLEKSAWRKVKSVCGGKLDSLQELLLGKFPKALGEIFAAHGKGLFPDPKEITLDCSCPDWASMCKHVAATLYGVGARLDEDPNLFFVLRKIEINDLIADTVKGKAKELLTKAKKKSSRIIEDQNLSSVFGIELDSVSKPAKKVKAKNTQKKKPLKIKKGLLETKKPSVKSKKTSLKKPIKKAAKNIAKTSTKKATTKTTKCVAKANAAEKPIKKPAKNPKAKTLKKEVKKVAKKKDTKKL